MKKNKSKSQKPSQDRKDGKKVIADPRFEKLHSDPRFQKPSIHKAKVAIDSRFNLMFTDKRFSGSSAPLDKRGKPKKQASVNPLRWYYRVEEEEEEKKNEERGGEGEEEQEKLKKNEVIGGRKRGGSETESSDSDSGDELDVLKSEDEDDEEELDSDATTSTTDTDEEKEDLDVDDGSSDVEEDVPVIESETHRLAAVNMDWDRIKAVDLFVVLSSFVPKGGQIVSVAVYPSEFGLKRMEEEAVSGPVGLFDNDDKDDRDASDDEIDDEKVRNYEKSRLRYYFAVVECDSSATADYLYKACDGHGFGGEDAYPLDLRFIPNSVEFKHQPRDVAEELPAGYEGLYTKTRGLQHTNLLLSWDEDDPHRARTLKRKFNAEQPQLEKFMANTHTKRGKAFTPALDKAICNAYLCISQDAVIGISQAQSVFWNRILENYVTNTGDNSRTLNSIQSRWREIQKLCGKWSGYLKSVEALNQSGQTDAGRVEEANRLFFQEHRKEFAFEHCWNILKEHIKWHDVPNTSKKVCAPTIAASSTPQSPDCSQTPSTYVSLESDHTPTGGSVDSPKKRPAGKKREKEAIRKSKIQDAKDALKVQIEERKVKAMEEMAANEKREIERKEKETDMQIMSMNLSEIQDPRQKAYYNMMKNQIMDKLMGSANVEAYYPQYSNSNEDEE